MIKSYILTLMCFALYGYAEAQFLDGLDPSFANNGIYLGDTGIIRKIFTQPDKKTIIVGADGQTSTSLCHIKRFKEDGSIDSSFANNGTFIPFIDGTIYPIYYGCLQPDGKILLSSETQNELCLIRLKSDGSLDSNFGTNGLSFEYLGIWGSIISFAVQSNGNIVVCGRVVFSTDELMVARYLPNGTLDSSFGNNGAVWSIGNNWGFTYPYLYDIAVMVDGRIVVGGSARIDAVNDFCFTAIRFLPDGALDTTFNHTGVAYTKANLPGLIYTQALLVQPDGKVFISGYADSLAIIRFDISGQLDNSFGTNGLVKLDPPGRTAEMLIQPDGKIVLGGHLDTCFALYRLWPDGSRDNNFGINGRVVTKLLNASNTLTDIALQPDGKLIAGGVYYQGNSISKVMLSRYTVNATSVFNIDLQNRITVYPNPANDYISIQDDSRHHIRKASIYSIDGKHLRSYHNSVFNKYSTDGLADGIYYLQLELTNKQSITKKIIINKG